MSETFPPDVVDAIKRHMNTDHAEDSLLICRSLGGQPAATHAAMTGLDAGGILFVAAVGGTDTQVKVPWSGPVTERAQVRLEVVRMYHEACEALGVPARQEAQH